MVLFIFTDVLLYYKSMEFIYLLNLLFFFETKNRITYENNDFPDRAFRNMSWERLFLRPTFSKCAGSVSTSMPVNKTGSLLCQGFCNLRNQGFNLNISKCTLILINLVSDVNKISSDVILV